MRKPRDQRKLFLNTNRPPKPGRGQDIARDSAGDRAGDSAGDSAWDSARDGGLKSGLRSESGFTLIELMVVLLLITVLLALGGPSFQNSLQRNRLQSTVSGLATALSFARAEAVIRSEPVALCASTNASTCSGSNWETGWLVFVDDGAGGAGAALDGTRNGTEEILRIGDQAPVGITIRSLNFVSTNNIVFLDSGRVLQDSSGTVTVCDVRGVEEAQGIIVEVSGQGRRAVDIDADDVRDDDAGNALICP